MSIRFPACCALLAVSALATAPARAHDAKEQGMVVVRDAATGLLRGATPAEVRALRAADPSLTASRAHAPSTVRPDGSRTLRLGDGAAVYSVIRRDADGHTAIGCVQADSDAAAARSTAAPTTHQESHHDLD